jgi:hypothetical protein
VTVTTKRWKRNTAGLVAAVSARAEAARVRAESAIDALERERAAVNFTAVAARAGVTKAYLYAHEDLRARIGRLRAPVGAVDRRVASLEAEVRRLHRELETRLSGVNR